MCVTMRVGVLHAHSPARGMRLQTCAFSHDAQTVAMLNDNPSLVTLSLVFCVSVFVLNSFSVLVTFMLSSVCPGHR